MLIYTGTKYRSQLHPSTHTLLHVPKVNLAPSIVIKGRFTLLQIAFHMHGEF